MVLMNETPKMEYKEITYTISNENIRSAYWFDKKNNNECWNKHILIHYNSPIMLLNP